MSSRIGFAVLILSLASTASAAVPQSAALGANQGNEVAQSQTQPFLLCSDKAGAMFMLLKTDSGFRLLTLLSRMGDATGTQDDGFTVDLAMNLDLTERGSEVISLDRAALAGLAAGSANIDPAAYLRSTITLKRLTSMVADTLDDPDATLDGSDPKPSQSLQHAMGASLKTNTSQAENNALSMVAPSSTHKNVVFTLGKDDNSYHFQILVAGDGLEVAPDTAMSITIKGQNVDANFDEFVLDGLRLETQDLEPVADETGAGETDASIAPADIADTDAATAAALNLAATTDCSFQTVNNQLKLVCLRISGNQLCVTAFHVSLGNGGLRLARCAQFKVLIGPAGG